MEEKLVSEVQCDIRWWHTGNVGVLFVNSYSTLMWREWSQNLELDFICRIWYSVWYHDSLICILNRHLALDLGSWSHAPDGGVREFDDAAHLWVTPLRVRYYDTKKRWVGSQDLYFWELGCWSLQKHLLIPPRISWHLPRALWCPEQVPKCIPNTVPLW